MTVPPRIPPVKLEDAPAEARPIFDAFMKERGNIPNMFRTAALRPKHMATMNAHFRTVMNEGDVSKVLKELLSVRVSSLNKCRY